MLIESPSTQPEESVFFPEQMRLCRHMQEKRNIVGLRGNLLLPEVNWRPLFNNKEQLNEREQIINYPSFALPHNLLASIVFYCSIKRKDESLLSFMVSISLLF